MHAFQLAHSQAWASARAENKPVFFLVAAEERFSFRRGLILSRNRNFFKGRKKERKEVREPGWVSRERCSAPRFRLTEFLAGWHHNVNDSARILMGANETQSHADRISHGYFIPGKSQLFNVRARTSCFDSVRHQQKSNLPFAVRIYAPLPLPSLRTLVRRLRFAAPQWQGELTAAWQRAKQRLSRARVEGVEWYWPAEEKIVRHAVEDKVRLLTPFDPVVWDRAHFQLLWRWEYRFEAYPPPAKRRRGYYALPLLWQDRVIGWGNLTMKDGALRAEFGYVGLAPLENEFKGELERIRDFLGLEG
jgi:hypothetical protein